MFKDKTLLISGGTGSFGNAVMRRFLHSDIGEIRVLSRDEKKQDDMRKRYNSAKLKFYLGDVRDYASVRNAMAGVDFVFNAAALKQVPSCEFFPMEAVRTNVMGTDNVIDAAIESTAKMRKLQFEGEETARTMQKKRAGGASTDPTRVAKAGPRDKSTINRLNMYRGGKPVRNAEKLPLSDGFNTTYLVAIAQGGKTKVYANAQLVREDSFVGSDRHLRWIKSPD
jgi:NAD(P)-dependent dehydrogenase (short-subunit alcohol dehydrogenase family)